MKSSANYSSLQYETGTIQFLHVKKAALTLRALNHELRQDILKLLESEQELTVTEIYIRLRIEQSVASQHLAILRRTQIVKTIRSGKYIRYAINHDRLREINDTLLCLLA